MTLVYQHRDGDRWLHLPGRPDFLSHKRLDWTRGGIYTAANTVEHQDEYRLYFTGTSKSHGWAVAADWNVNENYSNIMFEGGIANIGYASWKKDRLFGWRADPEGTLRLIIPPSATSSRLYLNYKTGKKGSIKVQLSSYRKKVIADNDYNNAKVMSGDTLRGKVKWNNTDSIPPSKEPILVEIHLKQAEIYAFDTISCSI